MIDRDQLTEALAEYDRGEGRMLDGWATEILVIVEAARWARDFPTGQQVEAAASAIVQKWSGLREGDTPAARADRVEFDPYWTDIARAALVAVRRVVYGDNGEEE